MAHRGFASGPSGAVTWVETGAAATACVDAGECEGDEDEENDYDGEECPTTPVSPVIVIETVVVEVIVITVVVVAGELSTYEHRGHGREFW